MLTACTGWSAPVVPADLPEGLELVTVAAAPLVNHPIMGTLDERGRLYLGDAVGVNLDKAGLEKEVPNRVLLLEDTDGDGVYDKSTVFADKMTFPQGAVWLNGSLYVASPPGIWKLTDTNGDGVADEREMIVGGFDYTGNAADVHGPFLHPTNGRLYWCHGRKGHKVVQKDGTLVHEGLASGIWSCRPDGSDVQWHALSSADNPTEIDFTPEGDIIGTVNLQFNQPRGDTLLHWLYGAVYERADQLKAIAGLPRTLKSLPIAHNFGHVAVSGTTFYRSGGLNPAWQGGMFVALFNSQKLVRMDLRREGATYQATQEEFLKLQVPDRYLTDVIEDADGTLLVLDTGGWFRNGCPSSLMEKPEIKGAVYRVQRKGAQRTGDPYGATIAWEGLGAEQLQRLMKDPRWWVRQQASWRWHQKHPAVLVPVSPRELASGQPAPERQRATQRLAESQQLSAAQRPALLAMLAEPLEPALEHGAMYAALATQGLGLAELRQAREPALIRRLLVVVSQLPLESAEKTELLHLAQRHFDAADPELAATAVQVVAQDPQALGLLAKDFQGWLQAGTPSPGRLAGMAAVLGAHLSAEAAQPLVAGLLAHDTRSVRQAGWRLLAEQSGRVSVSRWLAPLEKSLREALGAAPVSAGRQGSRPADLPLILDAIAKLGTAHFDEALQALVAAENRPAAIRLKALAALSRPGQPLSPPAFTFLQQRAADPASALARIEASRLLAAAKLSPEQLQALAPLFAQAEPIELRSLLRLVRVRIDEASGRLIAEHLARSPHLGSMEESVIKSAFSNLPASLYETQLAPAIRAAEAAHIAKRRQLEALTLAVSQGRPEHGQQVYEQGKGACIACHQVATHGRAIGPNLSQIGRIRTERDLLESILFPNATLARDYETHVIETADGQNHLGLIKSNTPEGLLLLDVAGQTQLVPHPTIVANTALPTSLMPAGLEQTMSQQELLDLVAWLASLK